MKSDKTAYITYADIESLIKNTNWCTNNLEKSSTTKWDEHIPCGYSISTISVFDHLTKYIAEKIVWKSFENL